MTTDVVVLELCGAVEVTISVDVAALMALDADGFKETTSVLQAFIELRDGLNVRSRPPARPGLFEDRGDGEPEPRQGGRVDADALPQVGERLARQDEPKQSWTCEQCPGEVFTSPQQLGAHNRHHHPRRPPAGQAERNRTCEHCGGRFPASGIARHEAACASKLADDEEARARLDGRTDPMERAPFDPERVRARAADGI